MPRRTGQPSIPGRRFIGRSLSRTASRAGSRARRPVAALVAALVVAAVAVVVPAPVADAAITENIVDSTDGGLTWTNDATVAAGGNVLVRVYYNNDQASTIAGTSVTTTLPSGFTRVPGTTQVCLNPDPPTKLRSGSV